MIAFDSIVLAVTCVAVLATMIAVWSWFLLSAWKAHAELLEAYMECSRVRDDLQDRIDALLADGSDRSSMWKGVGDGTEDDEEDDGDAWKKVGED